jgi:hypothetical protein
MSGDKNPAWRGGHAGYRGPNWQAQRRLALDRDGHRCLSCGTHEGLTVNHRIPFRLFTSSDEANALDNLATLCRPCHSRADNEFWRKHPLFFENMRFPNTRLMRTCERCQMLFMAKAHEMVCLSCCTFTCAHCESRFVSRKRRPIKYCSRSCRNAALRDGAKFTRLCGRCGIPVRWGSLWCRQCFITAPVSEARPGRRPGRHPKDRAVGVPTAP